ncbi:MAG TPA: amino acid adenylation domain-containing protein [Bdellovibrionota bacterium]|nr:amino acid adenylation domain-containing protein [Bdellovibrionota bacterium]
MKHPQSLIQRVEVQVRTRPHAPAVRSDAGSVTYRELWDRSARVAAALAGAVGAGQRAVGVCLSRGPQLPVGVLGILRAGAGYVPLDAAYPAQRLQYMLSQSGAKIVLVDAETRSLLSRPDGVEFISIEDCVSGSDATAAPATPERDDELLAYVIFTSGSTGQPKGVVMPRGPLTRLLDWQRPRSKAGAGTVTLQFTPMSFDVSFQELFATFETGGTLLMIRETDRLDPDRLLGILRSEKVERLFLPFVALNALCEVAGAEGARGLCLREVITAGEQLVVTRHLRAFFSALPGCTLDNQYGPSESHVVTAHILGGSPEEWPELPPIGHAVTDAELKVTAEGELWLGGPVLAEGYAGRPDLTQEKFVTDDGRRYYRTGDLVRAGQDGGLEYLGRMDGQVKIRGHRVEPGEIEAALSSFSAVSQSAVIARDDRAGIKELVAYLILAPDQEITTTQLRAHLRGRVPEYMVPSTFVRLESFPKTPSGKVDRRSLPAPSASNRLSAGAAAPVSAPSGDPVVTAVRTAFAETLGLELGEVSSESQFFELGGNSLLALKAVAALRRSLPAELAQEVSAVALFEAPTVSGLAKNLIERASGQAGKDIAGDARKRAAKAAGSSNGVAIVAVAGRFPGAANIDELWKLLTEGRDSVTRFSAAELDPSLDPEVTSQPGYVRARGVLPDADLFDAGAFGVSPKEAEAMDPQQRVFLEICLEALERGAQAGKTTGSVGVFAGTGNNTYYTRNVLNDSRLIGAIGEFNAMVANEKDYVAMRVAHKLNLKGPALSIHSACSTSLVAVVQAVHSLLRGECDLALAGGASVTSPVKSGYLYQEGGMLSADGSCRPFDESAQGTVFSDGAGVVLLKRLEDAQRDGDTILSVIRGAALNNDGAEKASFTAPSVQGQAAVIAAAQAQAGWDSGTIQYVEAHGTATPLGDPVEVQGLGLAFKSGAAQPLAAGSCALGSIKGNFGHMTAAAGVAGLIKTALSIHHRVLPSTAHFKKPNPKIDFASTPFFVSSRVQPWPRPTQTLRAGVSSFGVGGTNAHVVLEEAPPQGPAGLARPVQLVTLSARSLAALEANSTSMAHALQGRAGCDLADAAYSLSTGRGAYAWRRAILASSGDEAASVLRQPQGKPKAVGTKTPPVTFLFPGQGSQYVGMGKGLYETEPVFRAAVDRCSEILLPLLGEDLRATLFAEDSAEAQTRLRNTFYTQPGIFVLAYSLSQLLMRWGIRPARLVGHSVGEFVAAVLAGVMSLESALGLITARARAMASLPGGVMLSVRQPVEKTVGSIEKAGLQAEVQVASINAPSLCVLAGPADAVLKAQTALEAEGAVCKPLHTSHAFHSAMMDPAVEPFRKEVAKVQLSAPRIPIISTVTGRELSPQEALNPEYWARHMRETVNFSAAIQAVLDLPEPGALLELGPRGTLAILARQHPGAPKAAAIAAALSDRADGDAEPKALLKALGDLWCNGVDVDWTRFYENEGRRRVALPATPLDRKRFWAGGAPARAAAAQTLLPLSPSPLVGETPMTPTVSRKDILLTKIREVLEESSGNDLSGADMASSFLELGLDSLLLTQLATQLQKAMGTPVTFRQLLEETPSPSTLAEKLHATLPADKFSAPPDVRGASSPTAAPAQAPSPAPMMAAMPAQGMPVVAMPMVSVAQVGALSGPAVLEGYLQHQVSYFSQQLVNLRGSGHVAGAMPAAPAGDKPKAAFGAGTRITTAKTGGMTAEQKAWLDGFAERYNRKTAGSKKSTAANRDVLADPRVVSGFRPEIKEIIYPIVVDRSEGSYLYDIDGNKYVDMTCGFGSNFFGNGAEFIRKAVHEQLDKGYEIGPQNALTGTVARLFCEVTGNERTVLCNTGSEAVLGAVRLARTVTGRDLVAVFSGAYHGINDEVILRPTRSGKSLPAAPGIPESHVENMLILEYGSDEALKVIRERAHELAAVLVEPVQSRRPDLQPGEFLKEVRAITEASGSALIFDEVITGFRIHPGGAQAHFGIRADLATYGKIFGGGMPVGAISGKAKFMDALDGGSWKFGDDSMPTVGVTYFAGTFVRHPLALAASKVVLEELKAKGTALTDEASAKAKKVADGLNELFHRTGAPLKMKRFGSLMKLAYTEEQPYGDLLYPVLREKGLHIWDARPSFVTLAHTDADIAQVLKAFEEAVAELQAVGIIPGASERAAPAAKNEGSRPGLMISSEPPVKGARLGRDSEGNPAWYVADPAQPGKFVKV